MGKKVLVTGSAGFIGFHLVKKLLQAGHIVVGLDNLNDYYSVQLKMDRLSVLGVDMTNYQEDTILKSSIFDNHRFIKMDLTNQELLNRLFEEEKFDFVCNLAAQAGVRFSITHPNRYIQSNIVGFINLLEAIRKYPVEHLVYASSSSVYGDSVEIPFSEKQQVNKPVSLYAATKVSNELMAHTYSHLYDINSTGLRFFTVYGPWGRPDMAIFLFTKAILNDQPIKVFNNGDMYRDFTFVDDIIEGVFRLLMSSKNKSNDLNNRIYNIGNGKPVHLGEFITTLEEVIGKKAIKNYLPLQAGDVYQTFADTSELFNDIAYKPSTNLRKGITSFVDWYKEYNEIE
jgi:UDP-glucuronate 4-epimerase